MASANCESISMAFLLFKLLAGSQAIQDAFSVGFGSDQNDPQTYRDIGRLLCVCAQGQYCHNAENPCEALHRFLPVSY